MEFFNSSIDMIQSSKKSFVDATVTNETIREGLHEFVDTQTQLCKVITKNVEVFTKEIGSFPNMCKAR